MSTTSAAQVEMEPRELASSRQLSQTAHRPDLKAQAAERLAAHRALRGRPGQHAAGQGLFDRDASAPPPQSDTRAMRIAAAVAERYAHSQSYRAFLAVEAEHAAQRARAAAEAARDAEAVAAAQQQLLSDLENWTPEEVHTVAATPEEGLRGMTGPREAPALSVRLFADKATLERGRVEGMANAVPDATLDEDERQALDEEIAFRQAPVFEEFMEAATPLTTNLIEFPRQLVAARKARPRLAEGPLRRDSEDITSTQLRIFEVEAEHISTVVDTETGLPEWSSIRLSACAVAEPETAPQYTINSSPPVIAAPFGLRLMAATVDGAILAAAFLVFVTVVAYIAGEVPTGQAAVLGSAGTLAAMFLAYQALFFTFGEATPGMRYARIGLCTLTDDNPSRAAMRRRIVAVLLAACSFGLGFLWAWLDHDRLGWHDRLSGMYQRSY